MSATELYMVEGDTAPYRQFTVTRDGVAVDLTGATIKLILSDTSTATITNAGHQNCAIQGNPNLGVVQYDFAAGDIASASVHFGDLQISYNSGQVETEFDRILIRVRPKVATVS